MKNLYNKIYNKIYNAVNEGIQKALIIDPEQNDVSINYSYHKINNQLDFSKDFVDLGLSVKWAKCNIGATCNYYNPESWYGNYYAWGELESKHVYNKDSYDQTLYEKYNKGTFHILQPEDDIVTQTYYGKEFRMPTIEEIKELLNKSKIINKWKTNYQGVNGLNGREFTSKKTGNSIFIPATSNFDGSTLYNAGSECGLWSISHDSDFPYDIQSLYFDSGDIYISSYYCFCGLPVRGIYQK